MKLYFIIFLMAILTSCSQKQEALPSSYQEKNTNSYYDKAWDYLEQGNDEKGFEMLNKAKDVFLAKKDSFSVAKCLVNMAIIQERASDNLGSIETSIQALGFMKEKEEKHFSFLFSTYNNIGVAYNNLKNYNRAEKYYKIAFSFVKDDLDKIMLENNLANCFFNQKKYLQSVKLFQQILNRQHQRDDVYYKISNNLAKSSWYYNPSYNPLPKYWEALAYYTQTKDDWGLDASYSFLANYYSENKKKDSALYYSHQLLEISKKLSSPIDQLEALETLISVEKHEASQQYFKNYKKISDSLQITRSRAKNQFAAIRFESEKHRLENIHLEKELDYKNNRIFLQKIILISIISLVTVAVLSTIILWRRRKQALLLQSENKIKEERLTISKKVHDIVANGLYQVMQSVEHQEDLDKEQLLDDLDIMYQKSRDLSYSNKAIREKIAFQEEFSRLISSFQSTSCPIFVIGNEENNWKNISSNSLNNLYQIIRELLINSKKHSQADKIIIRISLDNTSLHIVYTDNGIGFPKNHQYGNGMKNLISRTQEINSKIDFDNLPQQGIKVNINIPKK
ncbi:tetratricopeptide repeat-containing sensor histidine kinase [Elizabethkingia sp. JS20170427COW]|uniref:tetratricopeptide repeat-containing sensor histidine kinase n=1 Tax=Elizabethkingia sp. JS20170427COW TaxID=2583851 RepID=UPI001110C249|nr:tetratricopeptide repeat-containing sensor histidine kinase [Elizabethkingia sp. JS20170427COW]QCX52345.1 tetratricopeptide repeat protein [Elizabethkingia sp. JS20170427COW]